MSTPGEPREVVQQPACSGEEVSDAVQHYQQTTTTTTTAPSSFSSSIVGISAKEQPSTRSQQQSGIIKGGGGGANAALEAAAAAGGGDQASTSSSCPRRKQHAVRTGARNGSTRQTSEAAGGGRATTAAVSQHRQLRFDPAIDAKKSHNDVATVKEAADDEATPLTEETRVFDGENLSGDQRVDDNAASGGEEVDVDDDDEGTTMVTIYHKQGVSQVAIAEDGLTSDKLKEFIRYKERKYNAVNRLNRICMFLVVFLFLTGFCLALGLSNESWFSVFFFGSGVREGYGVFRACANVNDRGTCLPWLDFPEVKVSITCDLVNYHGKVNAMWTFAILDAVCVGVAGALALAAAFRPTRSKFHVAIVALSLFAVPCGVVVITVYRGLISCVTGQCSDSNVCSDGYGWGMYVFIGSLCTSFISAGFASSMRSYVYLIRRQTKRELRAERQLKRSALRSRSSDVFDVDASGQGNDDGGEEGDDDMNNEQQREMVLNDPFDYPNEHRTLQRNEPLEEEAGNSVAAAAADGGDHNSSNSSPRPRRQHQQRGGFAPDAMSTTAAVRPPAATEKDEAMTHIPPHNGIATGGSVDDVLALSMVRRSSVSGTGRAPTATATSARSRGHSRIESHDSVQVFHHARNRSHTREESGDTLILSSSSRTPTSANHKYITARDMGVEITGAEDWVYVEHADMYYSFLLETFWDPINREYYCCRTKLWQENVPYRI